MEGKAAVNTPLITDLIPTYPLVPAGKKKKKGKACRKMRELLVLKEWSDRCSMGVKVLHLIYSTLVGGNIHSGFFVLDFSGITLIGHVN